MVNRVIKAARRVLIPTYEVITAPATVSPRRHVPSSIVRPPYAMGTGIQPQTVDDGAIPILTAQEIACLKKACEITRDALDLASKIVRPGVTGDEVDAQIHDFIISKGAYPSPLGYMDYPKSVCVCPNNVICHGIPDSRVLKDGDIVSVDVTSYIDGFHGDSCRTFLVGNVDAAGRDLLSSALASLEAGIAICKPGAKFSQIGTLTSQVAAKHGHTICKNFIGHGIGRAFHCPPQVFHSPNNYPAVMAPGMAFTIEPCVNEFTGAMHILSDGWTAVTRDSGRCAQFEHTILITESGHEVLTRSAL